MTKHSQEAVLICVVVSLAFLDTVFATRCLQCKDTPVPFGCNTVVECSTNEECYMQQFVNPSGLVMYNMGCMPSQTCRYKKREVNDANDVVTCLRCCHDDYCNLQGCGTNPGDLTQRGPKCYSCPNSFSPDSCRQTMNCELDQMCGLVHATSTGSSTPEWKGRCISKVQCHALASITTSSSTCSICCTGDLCNDRCRHTTAPPIGIHTTAAPVGVKCLQCDDVPHPFECDLVKICSPEELCYVQEYVTSAGVVRFETGCRSKQRCVTGKRDVYDKRSNKIAVCMECCHGNLCNTKGCAAPAKPAQTRGPKCFNCPATAHPDDCRDTATCSQGEVCALFRANVQGSNWKSSCMLQMQCDAISKIQSSSSLIGKKRAPTVNDCVKCCSDDFCNANCQNSSYVMATSGSGFTAPTTKATTHVLTTHPTPKPTTHAPTTTTHAPTTTTHAPTTTTHKPTHAPTTHPPKPTTLSPHDICHQHGYGYDSASHLCYRFHYAHRAWADANAACTREGAHLAVVDTQAKWTTLLHVIQASSVLSHQAIFIGAYDPHHTGQLYWTNGDRVTYAYWDRGQPNDPPGSCAAIYPSSYHFHWHDVNCHSVCYYVCTIEV